MLERDAPESDEGAFSTTRVVSVIFVYARVPGSLGIVFGGPTLVLVL